MKRLRINKITLFIVITVLILCQCDFKRSEIKTVEQMYNERLSLNEENDSFQSLVAKKLRVLNFNQSSNVELLCKDLFDTRSKELILVDKLIMDYSVPCDSFLNTSILVDKEYCQYLMINRVGNQSSKYIRGFCDYDLLGFNQSYDQFGFGLDYPTETLFVNDTLLISREERSDSSIYYIIEPKIHREYKKICDKFEF